MRTAFLSRAVAKNRLFVVLWLAFIFLMSTGGFSTERTYSAISPVLHYLFPALTPRQVIIVHKVIRKSAHAFEYFVLGLLLLRSLHSGTGRKWTWKLSFLALMGVALWAVGDEFHQSFVATRGASFRDVAIDTAGGFFAQCVSAVWYRYMAR
jgi:VanZ family protein